MTTSAMLELTVALVANPTADNAAIAAILARKGLEVTAGTMNTTRASTRRTLAAMEEITKRQKRAGARKAKAAASA